MMEELRSMEEYRTLIKEFRTVCKKSFSNIYLMPDDIKRYIELHRVSYKKDNNGIVLFFDESTHYSVYLYVNDQSGFEVPVRDKKLLVRNMYRTREKNPTLLNIQKHLQELGFKQQDTLVRIQGDSLNIFSKCKIIEGYVKEMKEKGFRCIAPDFSRFDEIEHIIMDSGTIKDYQMIYRTLEEKKLLEEGTYLCIVNSSDEICAGGVVDVDIAKGIVREGAAAVKTEYKMKGLAPILSYYRYKWLCDKNIPTIQGWISVYNEPSLRYHRSLGYSIMDKYVNEWLLDV